jgi:hypothetical protein
MGLITLLILFALFYFILSSSYVLVNIATEPIQMIGVRSVYKN